MQIPLTWPEIALRLACTLAAGAAMGLNRSKRGHVAGLRTSMLVSLAACVAMLQVNLLLPLAGRSFDSFVMNDLMRLPLGILSGMGFIGAGAIVHRGNLVTGVTTAATLWLITVVGLCFGGGQIGLGLAGAVLGACVLTGVKVLEDRISEDHRASLVIAASADGPGEREIRLTLQESGLAVLSCAVKLEQAGRETELRYEVSWKARTEETGIPSVVPRLAGRMGVLRLAWTPQSG